MVKIVERFLTRGTPRCKGSACAKAPAEEEMEFDPLSYTVIEGAMTVHPSEFKFEVG